jgi:hypothetical protein
MNVVWRALTNLQDSEEYLQQQNDERGLQLPTVALKTVIAELVKLRDNATAETKELTADIEKHLANISTGVRVPSSGPMADRLKNAVRLLDKFHDRRTRENITAASKEFSVGINTYINLDPSTHPTLRPLNTIATSGIERWVQSESSRLHIARDATRGQLKTQNVRLRGCMVSALMSLGVDVPDEPDLDDHDAVLQWVADCEDAIRNAIEGFDMKNQQALLAQNELTYFALKIFDELNIPTGAWPRVGNNFQRYVDNLLSALQAGWKVKLVADRKEIAELIEQYITMMDAEKFGNLEAGANVDRHDTFRHWVDTRLTNAFNLLYERDRDVEKAMTQTSAVASVVDTMLNTFYRVHGLGAYEHLQAPEDLSNTQAACD